MYEPIQQNMYAAIEVSVRLTYHDYKLEYAKMYSVSSDEHPSQAIFAFALLP